MFQCAGVVGVLPAKDSLLDRGGALKQLFRLGVALSDAVELRQPAQTLGHVRMLWPKRTLSDAQRTHVVSFGLVIVALEEARVSQGVEACGELRVLRTECGFTLLDLCAQHIFISVPLTPTRLKCFGLRRAVCRTQVIRKAAAHPARPYLTQLRMRIEDRQRAQVERFCFRESILEAVMISQPIETLRHVRVLCALHLLPDCESAAQKRFGILPELRVEVVK